MYGVGYPVMDNVLGGHEVLWLVVILMFAKMLTSSLTIAIGGSGGVFAPSLFTGAMAGTAFGEIARHLFGAAVGSPAIYGIVAMGAVFGAAAQAPLTSIASVLEMTGNFGLTLPVMLGVGIAAGLSKHLTYGTIYTTKLLRRGTDIERPRPQTALQLLRVTDAMQPLSGLNGGVVLSAPSERDKPDLELDAIRQSNVAWPKVMESFLSAMAGVSMPYVGTEMQPNAYSNPDFFRQATESVLHEVADGDGGVILGRGSAVVLGDRSDVLRVRLDGPVEARILQACGRRGADEATIRSEQKATDDAREAYLHFFYGTSQYEARHYNVALDRTVLSREACIAIILRAAEDSLGLSTNAET